MAIVAIILIVLSYYYTSKFKFIASFKETLRITELPIIKLTNGNSEFNFVVDTGASNSVLNENMLAQFYYKPLSLGGSVYGIDGNKVSTSCVEIELTTGEHRMTEVFQVMNVPAFDNISEQHDGMQIAGVLGGTFLKKYGFIIDYKHFSLKK